MARARHQSEAGPASISLEHFGDYELLEELARGGMGVIYKARQVSLNRIVAVKIILNARFTNAESIQRFRAEAQAAANLHHPNIVAIFEIGKTDRQHYCSMEYIEGRNLAALTREKPLPALTSARYVQRVAEAMHYAHQNGILHRDLKPSNVLIGLDGEPRITDFGRAKRIGESQPAEGKSSGPELSPNRGSPGRPLDEVELTVTGQVLGSPSYMSPEQAAGRRSDVEPGRLFTPPSRFSINLSPAVRHSRRRTWKPRCCLCGTSRPRRRGSRTRPCHAIWKRFLSNAWTRNLRAAEPNSSRDN